MTCIQCDSPKVENKDLMLCGTCNGARRKAARIAGRPEKKRKPIKRFSDKRKEAMKEYSEGAEQWFKDNPKCKATLEGCTGETEHRHHLAGRGVRLNDKETFLPVCSSCHFQIHNVLSAKERREKGLLISAPLIVDFDEPHKI